MKWYSGFILCRQSKIFLNIKNCYEILDSSLCYALKNIQNLSCLKSPVAGKNAPYEEGVVHWKAVWGECANMYGVSKCYMLSFILLTVLSGGGPIFTHEKTEAQRNKFSEVIQPNRDTQDSNASMCDSLKKQCSFLTSPWQWTSPVLLQLTSLWFSGKARSTRCGFSCSSDLLFCVWFQT